MTQGRDKRARIVETVGRYESALVRYAMQITGDLDRARDVVQETFLRLCRTEDKEVDDHLPEWLFTVCRNRAIDLVRNNKKVRPMNCRSMDHAPATSPPPSDAAGQKEEEGRMLNELEKLPEPQQEVLRLKFKEGLSYKEISRITGNSVTNVGFLIHTGLKRLRERLA